MVAAILIATVIAASVYRLVVFGNFNNLHGGGTSAQTVTGESEVFLKKPEVEQAAASNAKAEGKLSHLSCTEIAGGWGCTAHFAGGLTVIYQGVWVEAEKRMMFSVEERKAALHFTTPAGP